MSVEILPIATHQKTRVPELSCDVVCVIMCLAVLVERRLVADTDTQTQRDRHRQTQAHDWYRARIASRGKNYASRGPSAVAEFRVINGSRSVSDVLTICAAVVITQRTPPN